MKTFIQAIRPKTLIASLSPIYIGTAMAYSQASFSPWIFLFTLLTGMGIQISCNFANDLFDYLKGADTEERVGPVRVTASGLVSIAQMKLMTFGMMSFTALCGGVLVYRGGMLIALLVALALLLALAYTAGPFPLAYLGLGEFFILIFFGPVATGFTSYLQTLQLQMLPFIIGIAPGLLSCSILVINNLRDYAQDQKAGKKTLVARFGLAFGKWEYFLFVALAPLIPLLVYENHPYSLVSLISLLPAILIAREVFLTKEPRGYLPLLGRTGKLLSLFTYTFALGYLL